MNATDNLWSSELTYLALSTNHLIVAEIHSNHVRIKSLSSGTTALKGMPHAAHPIRLPDVRLSF